MSQARRARVALGGAFALFGVLVGTWVSRIPAVKSMLGLDNRALGLALLGWPLGSVAASIGVPRLLSRFGSRPVVAVSLAACAGVLVWPGYAGSAWQLAVALFVFGLTTGAHDIAANMHGASVESAYGSSVFSRLHASWSCGAFVGAGAGALAAAGDVGVHEHFVVVACVCGAASLLLPKWLLPASVDRRPIEQRNARSWSADPVVLALGVVALAGFIVEASIADWAAVYLHEDVGTTAAVGAAGYATFAAVHLAVRFGGDRIIGRIGHRSVMVAGCLVAACGYALLVAFPHPAPVFVGVAVAAAGIAAVVPAAFGSAGRIPGVPAESGVATVTGISYVGWAAAPPLIGVLAGRFSLRIALLFPPAVALAGASAALMLGARVTLKSHADPHPPTPASR